MPAGPGVGTLREKPLHADLKRWLARDGDLIEEPVAGYVIDLVRDDTLIEIQTRGFSAIKRKLTGLLDEHQVMLVHPIAAVKWIVKLDKRGRTISRRRSPKRGSALDLFAELVSFPELVAHPGLTIEVLLTHEEEVRRFDGKKGWRRKGWVVEERRLLGVVDRLEIDSPGSLDGLLPPETPERFTTADLASVLGRPRRLAQQMTYCLRRLGRIERVGKTGNAIIYARVG